MSDRTWSFYRAFATEGARCALVTCLRCGAAVLIDPDGPDSMSLHDQWHASLETEMGAK